jgi:hypothetical protein
MPPVSKDLKEPHREWALEYRPHNIEWLLSDEGEDARIFFLDGSNARIPQARQGVRLRPEDRNGKIVDDSSIPS